VFSRKPVGIIIVGGSLMVAFQPVDVGYEVIHNIGLCASLLALLLQIALHMTRDIQMGDVICLCACCWSVGNSCEKLHAMSAVHHMWTMPVYTHTHTLTELSRCLYRFICSAQCVSVCA
jgi:hypothetical protein